MQEINDLIVKGLYMSIFGSSNQEMSKKEMEFQTKYDDLADRITPKDMNIPEELINDHNMPMWQKAIKEL